MSNPSVAHPNTPDRTATGEATLATASRNTAKVDSPLTHFEVVFCIYAILYYTDFWWAITGTLGPTIALIRYSILGISIILLSLRANTLLRTLPKGKWLWIYCAVSALSITWTINTELTFTGVLQKLLIVSVFSLYFVSRFNPRHQLYVIGCALGITVFVNLFYVFALPSIGIHTDDTFLGAWKGFYNDKNSFSSVMLWALAVSYILSFNNNSRFITRLARVGLFISPIIVILSTSRTALVLFILLFVSLTIWSRYLWKGLRTVLTLDITLFSTLIIVGSIISQWVEIVTGLGKDPTLSGRTVLWASAMNQISQRPLLGYGFNAFWTKDNPAARRVGDALYPGLFAHHPHNGFINILINTGWLGLSIFLIGFISTWVLALKYAYNPQSPEDSWPLAVMVIITLHNTTESTLISSNIAWLFYIMAYLSIRIWPRQPIQARATKPPTSALLPSTAADSSY